MKVLNKVAIVTGGAQGLGKGFTESLLKNGATVVIADVQIDVGTEVASEFCKQYGAEMCAFIKCDVSKVDDITNLFQKTHDMYGNIDIVVNNAGIANEGNRGLLLDINLKGVVEGSYLALNYMRKDKGGRGGLIVSIASIAGLISHIPMPVYSAAKHGIVGFTKALGASHEDVIDQGIRVCCICPATTMTPMIAGIAKVDPEGFEEVTRTSGLLEIRDVVDVFMKVVDNDSLNAAVVLVTGLNGAEVQFPDDLKGTKL